MDYEPDVEESDQESESQVTAPLQSTIPDPAAVSPGRASGALDSEAESNGIAPEVIGGSVPNA